MTERLDFKDVQPVIPKGLVTYDPQRDYPVKLLYLTNGILVVGHVISEDENVAHVLQPHEVHVSWDRRRHEIAEYEFVPFLNQVAYSSPTELVVYPFYKSALISTVTPTLHITATFTKQLGIKQMVVRDPEQDLIPRHEPDIRTVH